MAYVAADEGFRLLDRSWCDNCVNMETYIYNREDELGYFVRHEGMRHYVKLFDYTQAENWRWHQDGSILDFDLVFAI